MNRYEIELEFQKLKKDIDHKDLAIKGYEKTVENFSKANTDLIKANAELVKELAVLKTKPKRIKKAVKDV